MKGCGFCSHHQWEFLKNSIKTEGSSTLSTAGLLFPGAFKKSIACIRLGPQVTITAPYSEPLRILADLLRQLSPLTLGKRLPGMRLASGNNSNIPPVFYLMGNSGACPRNFVITPALCKIRGGDHWFFGGSLPPSHKPHPLCGCSHHQSFSA